MIDLFWGYDKTMIVPNRRLIDEAVFLVEMLSDAMVFPRTGDDVGL